MKVIIKTEFEAECDRCGKEIALASQAVWDNKTADVTCWACVTGNDPHLADIEWADEDLRRT